jgi:hypothetical protein
VQNDTPIRKNKWPILYRIVAAQFRRFGLGTRFRELGGVRPNRRFFRYGKLSGLRCLGWLNLSLSGPDLVEITFRTFCFLAKKRETSGNWLPGIFGGLGLDPQPGIPIKLEIL